MRGLLFLIFGPVITGIYSIWAILDRRNIRYRPRQVFYNQSWARWNLALAGIDLKVQSTDGEQFSHSKNYVVVANHQSLMDLPVLMAVLPFQVTILTKRELFRVPLFGWAIKALGFLPIDRRNQTRAIETIREAERIIVEKKLSVVVFPEGTRTSDGTVKEFKKGPFILAQNTGLEILPISIRGNYEVLSKKDWLLKPGPVEVTIHSPFRVPGSSKQDAVQASQAVRQTIAAAARVESD